MKALDVIKQLQAMLPTVSDLFSENIAVASMTYLSNVVTVTTTGNHGRVTGDFINIVGSANPISNASIVRTAATATAVTDSDHDLTLSQSDIRNNNKTVTLSGANEPEFNGTFLLTSVLNRRTYTFAISDTGATNMTGSSVVEDASVLPGFNGRYAITVTSPTAFTYAVAQELYPTASGSPIVKTNPRISGAVSMDRAIDAYTAQQTEDVWAFVVLGDVLASKDRAITSDLTSTQTRTTAWRQRLSQPFSIYAFIPSVNDIGGRVARDLAEDISISLFNSLLGVRFDTGLTSSNQYSATFVNHGFGDYDTSVYIHEYNFELAADIDFNDTVGYDFDTAFRDVVVSVLSDQGTGVNEATATIDLDEEPLP